jgi:hypothetical protein
MSNPGDMDVEEQRITEKEGIMTNLKQTLSTLQRASYRVQSRILEKHLHTRDYVEPHRLLETIGSLSRRDI